MVPDHVLIERWQREGDADARNQLVERYRGLVRAVAVRSPTVESRSTTSSRSPGSAC